MNYAQKIMSPIGELYLIANENALISLDNVANQQFSEAPLTNTHPILNATSLQLSEYFQGKRFQFDLPLEMPGTPFQQNVWEALRQIPFGEIWSYGQQANFLNRPKASRAVGGANGKNPIAIIVPCHRVVGCTGQLTGFRSGMQMKIDLLKHEGHQINGLQLLK
jgi:methylated-DNA-[protein]-cysteine S-methyltransferase